MNRTAKRQGCPVVAVVNMKGGVGKTTLTANVSREIFRRKAKRTLLIDLDPQFNLSQALYTRAEYEAIKARKRTIWFVMEPEPPSTVFHVSQESQHYIGNVDDYTNRLRKLIGSDGKDLCIVAGDFRLSLVNLREGVSQRTPRARFRAYIDQASEQYDLIVLDCNPSSSFLTRVALEVATHLLIPVRPDRYSILGVEMLSEYLDSIPTIHRLRESIIVINGVDSNPAADQVISELRAHPIYGPRTLAATVKQTSVLTARQDYTGFAVDRKVSYSETTRRMLASVADELATKLGVG